MTAFRFAALVLLVSLWCARIASAQSLSATVTIDVHGADLYGRAPPHWLSVG